MSDLESRKLTPVTMLGYAIIFTGAAVLAGWELHLPALTCILPGFVSMKANTAAGFILAGISLTLLGRSPAAPGAQRWAQGGALLVGLLGLLTLGEFIFGLNLGIDQLLFREPQGTVVTLAPGRMAPLCAFEFVLLAVALLLVSRQRIREVQSLALLTGLLGVLPLVGDLCGANAPVGIGQYMQMALHTSGLFILLSAGLLLLHPAEGLMGTLTGRTPGGTVLRRLAPFVLGVPAGLGWLQVMGESHGSFDTALGEALAMVGTMIMLMVLLWWTARVLNQSDAARRQTEANLRENEELFRAIFEHSTVGKGMISPDGTLVRVNDEFADMLGRTAAELQQEKLTAIIHPDDVASARRCLSRLRSREIASCRTERRYLHQDGHPVYCDVSTTTLWDDDGRLRYFVTSIVDISRRKREEEALQASQLRYRRLFESAQDGILILQAQTGCIVDVNPCLLELLHATRDELLGRLPWEVGALAEVIAHPAAFAELTCHDFARHNHVSLRDRNGQKIDIEFSSHVYVVGEDRVVQCNLRDITAQVALEARRELAAQVLAALNRSNGNTSLIRDVLHLIRGSMGLEAAGIRLRAGEDFPYYEVDGFPQAFINSERYLCARNACGEIIRDATGRPTLECLCGQVISGRGNSMMPYFTPGGSFWTNSTTDLQSLDVRDDWPVHARNRCNIAGYESMALIPLHSGDAIIGLMQLGDHRRGRFTLEMIQFLEGMGDSIGIALARHQASEAQLTVEAMGRMIRQLVDELDRSVVSESAP